MIQLDYYLFPIIIPILFSFLIEFWCYTFTGSSFVLLPIQGVEVWSMVASIFWIVFGVVHVILAWRWYRSEQ